MGGGWGAVWEKRKIAQRPGVDGPSAICRALAVHIGWAPKCSGDPPGPHGNSRCDHGKHAFFSYVAGHTHILPHCGFTNGHLRCHLSLVATGKSRIRVGEEVREWQLGKIVVFDDTFEHEVWNNSTEAGLVLLFDIFHPELGEPEIDALVFVIRSFRRHFMRSYWSSLVTGGAIRC
jgi:hypothetical protein